jgi:benzodiazapine receptor
MISKTIIFLILNFAALAIGGLSTSSGVTSEWYSALNKAPWTPPGWVFGFAWTFIMICFSFYMAYLWNEVEDKKTLIIMYALQWILNVVWNPVFFTLHQTSFALIIIISLTILIGYFLFKYFGQLRIKSTLLLPYFVWLLIASSLNAYIWLRN